ncbi:GlmU family protein [Algivirga pacifica]|uniref:GlmU family protein n=1 Tax=Algivirga pacifica TaxID=1162670 RepID=A0ABP9D5K1_9BACT
MNLVLFDDPAIRAALLPITYTRSISDIRIGIMTIEEKWSTALNTKVNKLTEDYLQPLYQEDIKENSLYINASVCPTAELLEHIKKLKIGEGLIYQDLLVAVYSQKPILTPEEISKDINFQTIDLSETPIIIQNPWDIFLSTRRGIIEDFPIVTEGRESASLDDPHTVVYGKENVFIEEGASVRCAVINAETGPVYISKGARIHEGAIVRGTCFIGEGAHINMGAKIHEDCSFGPYCKIGGETGNAVMLGYSNKGHDGYLGNSVIGEWCNLGADTNTSNLKNNYGNVSIWSYVQEDLVSTGQMFCGLIMGDHSKAGINTMFNTGTVVGVAANIFGGGFPDKFIPSFSWENVNHSQQTALPEKIFDTAQKVMARRGKTLTETQQKILTEVYKRSEKYRKWDWGLD